MVADGRTKKVRPLLDRGGLIHPRCHPDLSLILRVTARPAAAYLPMTRGVQPRGSGAMFPRVPGRIPPSAALLTHPARYSFHQSHCSYYTQWAEGLSRENTANVHLPPKPGHAMNACPDLVTRMHRVCRQLSAPHPAPWTKKSGPKAAFLANNRYPRMPMRAVFSPALLKQAGALPLASAVPWRQKTGA